MKKIFQALLLVLSAGYLSAQNPVLGCPGSPVTICDVTPNTPDLWKESYWHDPVNGVQDLSEAPTDLTFTVTDTCVITNIRYLLFLDLDQNGTQETVIDSDNLPGFNNVQFDNAFNANYTGGTPSAFDERPVGSTAKYGFALQTTTSGNNTTAHLAWNTMQSPTTYAIPELPYGTHQIKWTVTDACGNENTCEYTFIVKDCKPPIVVCLNGLSVNLIPGGQITMWATDFMQYAEDNSTPASLLKIGIRKSGTGTGFPVDSLGHPVPSITFDCSELGVNPIELWSIDLAGNADFCETYVLVQDNAGYCPGQTHEVTTCINFWKDGSPVNAEVGFLGAVLTPGAPLLRDSLGCLVSTLNIPAPNVFTVAPTLNTDPLNGVNTLDLIRIWRHILGLQPLGSNYALIAADANKSGSVTTFDILLFRRLLLGIYAELPDNTSWRFVDADFQFSNPNNPFQTAFPENITSTQVDSTTHFGFVALKVGDVDGNAYPGFGSPTEDRISTTVTLPDLSLAAGESLDLPLHFAETQDWLGLQLALQFDPTRLQIEAVSAENLPGWDENAWAQPQPGLLRLAWFDVASHTSLPGETILHLRIRALAPVRLREALSLAPSGMPSAVVSANSELRSLQLAFDAPLTPATTVWAPQPNPTTGSDVHIPVQLIQEETVRLQLTDMAGRVLLYQEEVLTKGNHQLTIPAAAFPQAGLYAWRVETATVVAAGKIMKM